MKHILLMLFVLGSCLPHLVAQANIEMFARVGGDLVPINDGDITAADPGQFFGVVDGGSVNGVVPTKEIIYELTNTGDRRLRIDLKETTILSSDEFKFGSTFPDPDDFPVWTVQVNETMVFSIVYTPTSQSSVGIFDLRSDNEAGVDPISFQFAISGQGNLGEPEVFYLLNGTERPIADGDVSPSTSEGTHFGDVSVGDTVSNALTIRHGGTSGDTLIVTAATIGGADHDDFTILNANGVLNDGQQSNFLIGFTPSSPGVKNATVSFNTNDPDHPVYSFNIRGEGASEPGMLVEGRPGNGGAFRLVADGSTANFLNGTDFQGVFNGDTRINTFQITNTGNSELTFSSAGISGDVFEVHDFPSAISPGATGAFSVSFSPTERGEESKALVIISNLIGSARIYEIPLLGEGLGPAGPEVTVERDNGDGTFSERSSILWSISTVFEGDPPVDSPTFRIRNTGNQILTITGLPISGTGSGQFAVSNDLSFPIDIGIDQVSPEFHFTMAPTIPNQSATTVNARVSAGGATKDYSLRATRIIAASSMSLTGSPEDGSFHAVGSGAAPFLVNGTAFPESEGGSVVSTFRITNTHGTEGLLFGAPEIAGPHAADFSIDGFSTETLAPGETRDFTVTFDSAVNTERTAAITFLSNDLNVRNFEINLLGNASEEEEEIEPAIIGFKISGRDAVFTLVTDPAKSYRLRHSSILAKSWADVPGVAEITGSTLKQKIAVSELIDPRSLRYFYRIEEVVAPR